MGEGDAALSVIPRSFYARPVLTVAPDLLGAVVSHTTDEGVVAIRLTEVEAYDGESDPGSHAFRGRTPRVEVMYGRPGHAYVYFTYGMHFCANLVCMPDGVAAAVLLRAGEVIEGVDLARARREVKGPVRDRDLARGPARLTVALGITGTHNGTDVTSRGGLQVLTGTPVAESQIAVGPRTGVGGDGATFPWRFHVVDEPTVSPYRRAVPRRRR